jgi:superfamily II DNA or RNA helicase
MPEIFATVAANVEANDDLRVPQRDGFVAIRLHYERQDAAREVGIVLPVGCGKSGLITLAPFAVRARRLLAITPYVDLADQLYRDFDFSRPDHCFYTRLGVLRGPEYPQPVPIRGDRTNIADVRDADVVITNIGQLQGGENRWLVQLPRDFFDLVVFDEGHHSIAETYQALKAAFPGARVINFSATPRRADGDLMPGPVIYSYPVRDAIAAGYVKDLRALVLNPAALRYVRREGDEEVEVGLEEVRRLGEEDADFRRSIVTSAETRDTIVDASIHELRRLRRETGENRLKIIASALNHGHCIDIVEAYRAKGLRADFVHSNEGAANDRPRGLLRDHELDVIVQVRMLGEGFDHPYLSVAAVFSIFRSLSPFVQFVGRVMRAIAPGDVGNPLNQGTVIYHAGSNIARRWDDFRDFSGADQEYYNQLLPEVEWNFGVGELRIEPEIPDRHGYRQIPVDIRAQDNVTIEEVPLIERDEEALAALRLLRDRYTDDEIQRELQRIPAPRWVERDAARRALDDRVRHAAGEILNRRRINQRGRDLDPASGRDNFVVVKSTIDRRIMALVGRRPGDRAEYTRDELETIRGRFDELVVQAEGELFNG